LGRLTQAKESPAGAGLKVKRRVSALVGHFLLAAIRILLVLAAGLRLLVRLILPLVGVVLPGLRIVVARTLLLPMAGLLLSRTIVSHMHISKVLDTL
jgi:hypothetical protein